MEMLQYVGDGHQGGWIIAASGMVNPSRSAVWCGMKAYELRVYWFLRLARDRPLEHAWPAGSRSSPVVEAPSL